MSKPKVLFVDDELMILKTIKRQFLKEDIEILIADSAMEGLEILAKEPVEVVVSDFKMPGMDGLQFLKRVKELYPDINRIMLSGYVEQNAVIAAVTQGIATSYFAKPWDTAEIKKGIAKIIEIKKIIGCADMLSVINSIDQLPSLPGVYNELLLAISEDKSTKDIAKIITKDTSFATRILQIVNSAFTGGMPISSIERAVVQLGVNLIKDILLTISINPGGHITMMQEKALEGIFEHSLLVNRIASILHRKIHNENIDKKYSSLGVLHDIGKIIQCLFFTDKYKKIVELQEINKAMSHYDVEEELGLDSLSHCRLGAFFIKWWNLPDIGVEVSLYHHTPDEASDHNYKIVQLINNADRVARLLESEYNDKEENPVQLTDSQLNEQVAIVVEEAGLKYE